MTFTLLSVIILLILSLTAVRGAFKGIRRGFSRSLFSLFSIIVSVITGSLLSVYLVSPMISDIVFDIISETGMLDSLTELIDNAQMLLSAILSMVLSSLVFVITFLLSRIVCAILSAIVFRTALKNRVQGTSYSSERQLASERMSIPAAGLLGAVSSLLVAITLFSPIIGTLKMSDKVFDIINSAMAVDGDEEKEKYSNPLSDYSSELGVNVLYYGGGAVCYNLSARALINKTTVVLPRELDATKEIISGMGQVLPSLSNITNLNADEMQPLYGFLDKTDDSYLVSFILSEVVSNAAEAWRSGESFVGVSRPSLGELLDPAFDSILTVLYATGPSTVSEDLTTLIDIFLIVKDSGIQSLSGDFNSMMKRLEEKEVLTRLRAALDENPRMKIVSASLGDLAIQAVAGVINFENYDSEKYDGLFEEISMHFNRLEGLEDEQKIEVLRDEAKKELANRNIEVPDEIAELLITTVVTDIVPDEDGYITPEILKEFFEEYANLENAS